MAEPPPAPCWGSLVEAGGGGLTLCPRSPPEPAEGPLGRLQLTLWYHNAERKLVAIVHGCR